MKKKINADKVSWGIIGVGDVCEVKSAPAMQKIANSELVAVMRRNEEKVKDYAQRHQVPTWYTNADELIADSTVNAIYIATPPDSHAEYVMKAAQAGKPVYVEKPMARTVDECEQMIQACENAGVPLYVAYYRRRLPNFEKIKSVISEGVIGDVRFVKLELYKSVDPDIVAAITSSMPINWRIDPAVSGGGYFFDLASHQLDFLDYVFGPIESVFGFADNQAGLYNAADSIHGSWKFANGIHGSGSWCFTVDASANKDELFIAGSKGSIHISFFGQPTVTINTSDGNEETYSFDLPKHIQQPLIQTVVDDILGVGECPSLGVSAKRTNWVMSELTKNYYELA
jgi:predicted dehydrogenase